jgi:hypothetical protein
LKRSELVDDWRVNWRRQQQGWRVYPNHEPQPQNETVREEEGVDKIQVIPHDAQPLEDVASGVTGKTVNPKKVNPKTKK